MKFNEKLIQLRKKYEIHNNWNTSSYHNKYSSKTCNSFANI